MDLSIKIRISIYTRINHHVPTSVRVELKFDVDFFVAGRTLDVRFYQISFIIGSGLKDGGGQTNSNQSASENTHKGCFSPKNAVASSKVIGTVIGKGKIWRNLSRHQNESFFTGGHQEFVFPKNCVVFTRIQL
jgi:hypothetical protein